MQPESFTHESHQTEESKPDEIVQPEATVIDEGTQSAAAPSPKKDLPVTSYAIGALIFLLLMAIIGIGGLGYWGHSLGNDLTASQQQLIELQGKYDTLLEQNKKLSADLVAADTELVETKLDLAATQTELSKSNQQLGEKNSAIKAAAIRLVVLRKMILPMMGGSENTSEAEATAMVLDWIQSIEDVKDPTLKVKFEDMARSFSNGNSKEVDFFDYLLQSIEDRLK